MKNSEYFDDILDRSLARRNALKAGGMALLGGAGLGSGWSEEARCPDEVFEIGFTPVDSVPVNLKKSTDKADKEKAQGLQVPNTYEYKELIRWGDPILANPEYPMCSHLAHCNKLLCLSLH